MADLSLGALDGLLFNGCPVHLNPLLTERVPHPRSPARARRRALLGHRQHYRIMPSRQVIRMPDGTMVMHPAAWSALKATIEKVKTDPGARPADRRFPPFPL